MRLIKIIDSLGNQMSIYAFYLRAKKRHTNTRIGLSGMVYYNTHHGYEMHCVFNLLKTEFRINQPLKEVIEFLSFKRICERKQDPSSLLPFDKKYLWPLLHFKGFYQSERLFVDMENDIRIASTLNSDLLNEKTQAMLTQIKHSKHAVSLYTRRGDYLELKHWKTTGGVRQLPYYLNVITEMNKQIKQPSYYVFSDDAAWVKENLSLSQVVFIDRNRGTENWQDIVLMSYCHHHIICNNTSSWWGAWLNSRENRTVIVPERWFQHCSTPSIYPAGWIKVPVN